MQCSAWSKKNFKIVVFLFLRGDPVLELQFDALCGAFVLSSFLLCNPVSADPSRMAASRFIVPAAACVILLQFAAESRESH